MNCCICIAFTTAIRCILADFTGSVLRYCAPVGVQSIVINLSICASVCPRAYLWNRWTDQNETLCADLLWPWLSPSLAALCYVMCFWFYGWCHIWPYGVACLAWVAASRKLCARLGWSLMSMNACWVCIILTSRVLSFLYFSFVGTAKVGAKCCWIMFTKAMTKTCGTTWMWLTS